MDINEILDIIESIYKKEDYPELIRVLWKMGHYITQEDIKIIQPLIDKGFLQNVKLKYLEYRLEKYFELNNITKISDKKSFIFKNLPANIKYPKGKNTSYDDLLDFITDKFKNELEQILASINVYDYTDLVEGNGRNINLYIHRQVEHRSNYYYDENVQHHLPKDDYIANLLKTRGVNVIVENPEELFTNTISIDLTPSFNKFVNQTIKEGRQKTEKPKYFITTLLLCIFLGGIGAHRLYTGKYVSALLIWLINYIAISAYLPLAIVSSILIIIDLIQITKNKFLTDSGNELVR